MPRIRSVKPEIRRSVTVAQWPREVRLAWIYLWGYLDDAGRGLDDMRLIVAELFPLDRDVTEKKMDRWLTLMATTRIGPEDEPPLCRYEVAGRHYLHAVNWRHQKINRPQPSRLPACPLHERSVHQPVNGSRTDSRPHSVNGSRTDSPPSRAPADQGSGIRDQGEDQGGLESLGEHRNETLPAGTATKHPPSQGATSPADARCIAHVGVADPPPCNGCRAARERLEKLTDRERDEAERAHRLAAEAAARNCTRCDGVWEIDADANPTGRRCDHRPLARSTT